MPSQTFNLSLSYDVDTSLAWSVEELISNYMTGIPLQGRTGEEMNERTIEQYIRNASAQLESALSIKIAKQRLVEAYDFEREHFESWGAIQVHFLVNDLLELMGKLNFAQQIKYPRGWISWKRQKEYMRMLHIVPGQQGDLTGVTSDFVAVFTGRFPIFGYSSANYIPNYWNVDYMTGWDKIPDDIMNASGKLASIQVLAVLGDIIFGVGIGSSSLSIDGLSQSITTTRNSNKSMFGARIDQYTAELKQELQWLKGSYKGVSFAVA